MCAKYYEPRCIFKKLYLVEVGTFAWYSVKIRVIFDVRFDKKQAYMKTETCKLYCRICQISLPSVIKIDKYKFELYRFKVGAFFEIQCI